jgi:hypothetical protein
MHTQTMLTLANISFALVFSAGWLTAQATQHQPDVAPDAMPSISQLIPCSPAQCDQSKLTILYNFAGANDGSTPFARVLVGGSGALYGTTQRGGTLGGGTVFELKPTPWGGPWTETVLYDFRNPSYPAASLTFGKKGQLYGTAYFGGPSYVGSVFELDPPAIVGGSWTENTIYSFSAPNGDPQNPSAGVVVGENGVLYGTTQYGGISANCTYYGCGAVYSLTPPATTGGVWTETTLYTFTGGNDGSVSLAGLVPGRNGELYGSTYSGGSSSVCQSVEGGGCGTVFELTPPSLPGGAWTERVLYAFTGLADGGFPSTIVMENGRIYGTTNFGGDLTRCGGYGCGAVFELASSAADGAWTERVLYSFKGAPDGLYPSSGYLSSLQTFSGTGVVVGNDGELYGTTVDGGSSGNCPEDPGCGTVFQLGPPGGAHGDFKETLIHSFTGADTFRPYTGVVPGPHDTLYGTTPNGGPVTAACPIGCGTVYEIKPSLDWWN